MNTTEKPLPDAITAPLKTEPGQFMRVMWTVVGDPFASESIPVFPCNPQTKRPYLKGGYKLATSDYEQISAWGKQFPDAMVGVPTGQLTLHVVADFDAKSGGLETYRRERGRLPDGCTAPTPGGGYHVRMHIPEGVIIHRSIGQLGPGFDVLGEGSYAIAPGSARADGKAYKFAEGSGWDSMPGAPDGFLFDAMFFAAHDRELLASHGIHGPEDFMGLPPCKWREYAAKLSPKLAPAVRSTAPLLDGRKKALLAFVEKGAVEDLDEKLAKAAKGERNATAIRECFKLWRNLWGADYQGLSLGEIEDHYKDRFTAAMHACGEETDRPGTAEDMWERCKADAAQNPRNMAHVGTKDDPASERDAKAEQKPEIKFEFYQRCDPATIDPRDWLYRQHYLRNAVTGTVAPGGTGKSSNAMLESISMACGRDLLTWAPAKPDEPAKAIKRLRVVYWNGEEDATELHRKVEAVCKHYRLAPEDTDGWLVVASGRDLPITMAKEDAKGFTIAEPLREALVKALTESKIDVLIVDPFVSSHAVSENDNNKIDKVAKLFGFIAGEARCGVELVHHVRKMNGGEVGADDARGGSAFKDACRSLRVLNKMTEDEAKRAMVPDRLSYFRVDDGKVNFKPAGKADWREIVSVPLGNARPGLAEDHVGVVKRFTWRDPSEGLPPDAPQRAQDAIRDNPSCDQMLLADLHATLTNLRLAIVPR